MNSIVSLSFINSASTLPCFVSHAGEGRALSPCYQPIQNRKSSQEAVNVMRADWVVDAEANPGTGQLPLNSHVLKAHMGHDNRISDLKTVLC